MNSDLALGLMSGSTWGQGLLAGIPKGVGVAHKFGEAIDQSGFQLHETGVVYGERAPYLITVMTRGPQRDVLPGVIADISRMVFEQTARSSAAHAQN